jgi:hypothetical protein
MSTKLPYLSSPGTLGTVLTRLKAAATPPKVTNDFVATKLQVKGGAGRAIPPFLKKIGFVAGDGAPTPIYQRFRNDSTSGAAAAEALKMGYKGLYEVNEYAHDLGDKDLKGLVLQVTGLDDKNRVVELILSTFKKLKGFADFEAAPEGPKDPAEERPTDAKVPPRVLQPGFNIGYTINLNLPPSTNIEVFNAIFKSLKENLLRGE